MNNLSKNFKEIYFPILVFSVSIFAFIYLQYVQPRESVEKMIQLKVTHDPQVIIPENLPAPKVKINLKTDEKSGVNIKMDFENFVLTPENTSQHGRPGEGHMHLFVNGYKVARVYSEWFHIDESYLETGENDITVTLNTDDHSIWALSDGSFVKDSVKFFKRRQ